jgi:hypothetical protein
VEHSLGCGIVEQLGLWGGTQFGMWDRAVGAAGGIKLGLLARASWGFGGEQSPNF